MCVCVRACLLDARLANFAYFWCGRWAGGDERFHASPWESPRTDQHAGFNISARVSPDHKLQYAKKDDSKPLALRPVLHEITFQTTSFEVLAFQTTSFESRWTFQTTSFERCWAFQTTSFERKNEKCPNHKLRESVAAPNDIPNHKLRLEACGLESCGLESRVSRERCRHC